MTTPTYNIDEFPEKFQEIIDDFQQAEQNERLELLLAYSQDLPKLPDEVRERVGEMEQVTECQTPFFLASEVEDGQVTFYYDVAMEAPTTRGYASILAHGLNGASPEDILKIPTDFYTFMGLNTVISPLRLRGVEAVINRMKRQMREYLAANG
jgi:cysteine desulfuration protein SufE